MFQFKKGLLATAVVSAVSMNAFAGAIDMANNTGTASLIAEQDFATGQVVTNAVTPTISWALGDVIGNGSTRYVRLELDNGATFNAAPTVATVGGTYTLAVESGGAGKSFVVVSVAAQANLTAAQAVLVTLNGIKVTNHNDVTASASMHFTLSDAGTGSNAISGTSDSHKVFTWTNGFAATTKTVTSGKIDVAASPSTTKFTSGGTIRGTASIAALGELSIAATTAAPTLVDGTASSLTNVYGAATTIKVTGDFTASQDLTNNVPDGTYTAGKVFLDSDNDCDNTTGTVTNFTVATDGQSATSANINNGAIGGTICYTTNTKSQIVPSDYTANITYSMETGFTNKAATELKLNSLSKNGSTKTQDFTLTPNGAFNQYFRILNTSGVEGTVYIKLTNEEGTSETIKLSQVEGFSSDSLKGGYGTGLISLNAIYAACVAQDSTFDHKGGKLRIEVNGEFSSIELDAVATTKDGNGFYMMNN